MAKENNHRSEDPVVEDMRKTNSVTDNDTAYDTNSSENITDSNRSFRIFGIIYFIVLFIILGTYISMSIPDDALRLHVYTADELSQTQQNVILVRARNLDNGSVFNGYKLSARWDNFDHDLNKASILNASEDRETMDRFELAYQLAGLENLELINENALKLARELNRQRIVLPLNVDGESLLPVPIAEGHPNHLIIELIDPNDTVVKTAYVPRDAFGAVSVRSVETDDAQLPEKWVKVDVPASFVMDSPNEVRIIAFDGDQPYQGTIQIEQTYGEKAEFPESVQADKSGITSIRLKLNYAADFKMTAGDAVGYASFAINEKTLNAQLKADPVIYRGLRDTKERDQQLAQLREKLKTQDEAAKNANPSKITPDAQNQHLAGDSEIIHQLRNIEASIIPIPVKITVPGNLPDLTVDYFSGHGWIDRQVIHAREISSNGTVRLPFRESMIFKQNPEIIYVRISTSGVPSPESSQTFAFIVSDQRLSFNQQVDFALQSLAPYQAAHPEIGLLSNQKTKLNCSLEEKDDTKSADCLALKKIRNEALTILTRYHEPIIDLRVKTEEQEAIEFDAAKKKHKSWMNIVLVGWFLLGLIGGSIAAYRQVQQRRLQWQALMANGTAEVEKHVPTISYGMAAFLLILFIGLCCSLYFMMQLL